MALDPFSPKPSKPKRPHLVDTLRDVCRNCGADGWHCWENPVCDPTSEAARKYRRETADKAVGRAVGY